jgi:hypothetical protein
MLQKKFSDGVGMLHMHTTQRFKFNTHPSKDKPDSLVIAIILWEALLASSHMLHEQFSDGVGMLHMHIVTGIR